MALNASAIAKKWSRRAGSAGPEYKAGVEQTPKDQAQLAIAAKDNYAEGVTAGILRGAFEKGLAKSGKAKWQRNSAGKGATNYPGGVRAAESDYQTGVQPYLSALDAIVYPEKGPRRSIGNLARVTAVFEAMSKLKESM